MLRMILSHGDNGEKLRFSVGHSGTDRSKLNPRDAGDAVKIGRLVFAGFDALLVFITLHITDNILIKRIKIVGPVRPAIRKGFVIVVEECIVWNKIVPYTQISRLIPEHSEIFDAVHDLCHHTDKRRIEFVLVPVTKLQEIPDLHGDGEIVFNFQFLGVVCIVFSAGPMFQIDFVIPTVHIVALPFLMYLAFYFYDSASSAARAARTAAGSVCWMCHSSSPGSPMGTCFRRKHIPLSTSRLPLM